MKTCSTFCRVCEPSCAMVAEVENDKIISLKPDKSHPVFKGFACHKGLTFTEIHRDPDRLNYPMRRIGNDRSSPGEFERVGWDEVIPEIASRIKEIQDRYGHMAIASYLGNPTAFDSSSQNAVGSFLMKLASPRVFSAGTQDCSNKFAAGEAVFGTSTLHPVPDIRNTDFLMVFGENPKVSHMSFISIANPMQEIRDAVKRGAKVVYINPRKIESATEATGEVVQVLPDSDVYLMAAMLNEIHRLGRFDEDVCLAHGKNLGGLLDFIRQYTPESVADVVGIPATQIKDLADSFSSAGSAAAHMSVGVNMGRQGTLAYWLLQMLCFVTGNLGKKGGNVYSQGFYPAAKAGRANLDNVFYDSPLGPIRSVRGSMPGNLLADMIEMEETPIRALFVMAGNPLLSIGGEEKLRKAFEKLELVVTIDLYPNATGALADYQLPATDMLEREDINICGLGMQYQPYVQYTPALVPPSYERKQEWWILASIEKALGLPSLLDNPEASILDRTDRMLASSDLSIEKLKTMPHNTAVLPEHEPERFFTDYIQTEDRKIDCCPEFFADAIKKSQDIFADMQAEEKGLKLIASRNNYMHNSWFQNVEKLKRGEHTSNKLHIFPSDAESRNLKEGEKVKVSNQWGEIEVEVFPDDELRPGVVWVVHGWGNQRTPGMKVANRYPGANVNVLLPTGPGSYDPLSNQAHMTGVPVEVSKL